MNRLNTVVLAIIMSAGLVVHGQNVASHYFLKNLPESNKLNPAFEPNCKFYIDLPVIGNSYFNFTGDMGFQDVLTSENGSLINLPVNSPQQWNSFVDGLEKYSLFETEANINMLGFGFKINKGYFHFNISERFNSDMRMPSSFFGLNNLADESQPYFEKVHDLSGLEVNTMLFQEISAGLSYTIDSKLTVGGKLKLLQGIAYGSSNFEKVNFSTSTVETKLSGVIKSRIASPIGITENADDELEFESMDGLYDDPADFVREFTSFKNLGFAVDLGVEYKVMPYLNVSASILDLGKINWKNKAYTYELKGEGIYEGIDETAFADAYEDGYFDNFVDSMGDQFSKGPLDSSSFSNALTPKLLLGAEYLVSDVFSLGVMSRTRFYKNTVRENMVFSANLNLYHFLTAGTHYNWSWSQPNTLGFTVAVKLFPMQIYFSTDLVPSYYRHYSNSDDFLELGLSEEFIGPSKFNGINAQVGVNFTFGCRKKGNAPLYHLIGD